ncbi:MAG: sulfite exporter TauE/SafE family protein [Candidatus Caenarcaniphilales bacterium]|nr:sulfite exporter TauE/SafE family protein [Candidatus Caenarcaniphilales bacterium]
MQELILISLGIFTGFLGGMLGVGGALFVIPALVYIFGFSQKLAQGTALAMMLPPIGILAVITYYEKGFIEIKSAIILCLGCVLGGWLGAKLAVNLPTATLQKIFGAYLIIIGSKMLFFSSK